MHQRNEEHKFPQRDCGLTVLHSDELQLLGAGRADGDDHPSGVAELGDQSWWQIGSGGGDEDGVERSVGEKAEGAVSSEDSCIGIAERDKKVASAVGEGRVAFDGEYLRDQFGEQSGDVTGAGSDFENLVGGRELERFEHARDDVRLRDGLAVTDGERMILVSLASVSFKDEFVAGHPKHGLENARVSDASGPELGIDHELARGG
jgi:hypothetical protein